MNMNTPLEYGPCFMIVAGNPGMAQKHAIAKIVIFFLVLSCSIFAGP